MGKKAKVKFGSTIHHTKEILDYVHIHVWGPLRIHLLEENTILSPLLMTILGETMTHKSEVLGIFVKWRRRMKLQTGRKIKILKSINRG